MHALRVLLTVATVLALLVATSGAAAAAPPDGGDQCTNTQSGTTFTVPQSAVDRVDAAPPIECVDRGGR